jgi:hypothetical protein
MKETREMKIHPLIILIFVCFGTLSSPSATQCSSRAVSIDLEKKHVEELKGRFAIQSDLPYTFEERTLNKSLSRVVISYRRKSGKDDFPEPTNPDFFKAIVKKVSNQYEVLGIKKMSADLIPGECP